MRIYVKTTASGSLSHATTGENTTFLFPIALLKAVKRNITGAEFSPEELQNLANSEKYDNIQKEIKNELKKETLSLSDLVDRLPYNKNKVEDAIRSLLQSQEIGETADWKFYLAVHPKDSS